MQTAEETSALNLKVDYTTILQDIAEKSAELTALHKEIGTVKENLTQINLSNEATNKELKAQSLIIEERSKDLVAKEKLAVEKQKEADELLKSTSREIKERVKELSRTNAYVLAAQEELAKLTKDIETSNEECKHLLILVARVEETKVLLTELENKKTVLNGEISTQQDQLDSKLKATTDKLALIEAQMVEMQKKSDIAQATLKSYTDQLYTAMNDYQVVKSRLEEKWKMTFPELELPLAL